MRKFDIIGGGVLAFVVLGVIVMAMAMAWVPVLPRAIYPGPGWTDVNYDIERVAIEGGWLYRSKGKLVFVPGAKV